MYYRGIVRGQTNTDVHDPEKCQYKYDDWGKIDECPFPQFADSSPGVSKNLCIVHQSSGEGMFL